MFNSSASVFAIGHVAIPIVLLLLYGDSNQFVIMGLAAFSLLWTLFICWYAFIRKSLDQLLMKPAKWLFLWIDIVMLAVIYTVPDWTASAHPIWISLLLVCIYSSVLGYTASFLFTGLSVFNLLLYSFAQNSSFLSVENVLNVFSMTVFSLLLGKHSESIRTMSQHDILTGLPSREFFKDQLTEWTEKTASRKKQAAVFFLDLDQFKYVNDTMGHSAGDLLLQTVSKRIAHVAPADVFLARLGGDEFALMASDITRTEEVEIIAKSLLEALQEPFTVDGRDIYITSSIGIALYPQDGTTTDTLMKNADTAMYWAKEQGRNNYQFYTMPTNGTAMERLTMETMLRKALEKQELEVYFQPRIDAMTEAIVAVEALIRWKHPEKGFIAPPMFIPLAEETGLIVPLGEYVLKAACEQVRKWHDAGYPKLRVSVNLSPRQFRQNNLAETIGSILQETGLEPEYLELEITEGAAMQNINLSVLSLRILKDLGVSISIDDFGTGYSSLNYLKRLPIDAVKIDKSFITSVDTDADDAAIVSAIVALAHILGLKVTAEGVETKAQLDYMKQLNCDEIQGYLFGKAMPSETLEEWIRFRIGIPDLVL
jgi:diguanylate cyclase (GGDEF)-like protein